MTFDQKAQKMCNEKINYLLGEIDWLSEKIATQYDIIRELKAEKETITNFKALSNNFDKRLEAESKLKRLEITSNELTNDLHRMERLKARHSM